MSNLRNTGWVVKNIDTGELDMFTNYPQSKQYADTCPLNEGWKWVEVEVIYKEILEAKPKIIKKRCKKRLVDRKHPPRVFHNLS